MEKGLRIKVASPSVLLRLFLDRQPDKWPTAQKLPRRTIMRISKKRM